MRLLIVSNAPLIEKGDSSFAYSPYVKELTIWAAHVDEIAFCCPKWEEEGSLLVSKIPFKIRKRFYLKDFNLKTIHAIFKSIVIMPLNLFVIFKAMIWAEHIHLRCPGNVGLLASLLQIFFPNKVKTVKYAGNWDPKAKQPWSYRLQKKILQNTILSRNIKVLVYGEWVGATANIQSFFTATYSNRRIIEENTEKEIENTIRFLFVGTLSKGKQPLYGIKLVEKLHKIGFDVKLDVIGDGSEHNELVEYCKKYQLQQVISIQGNKTSNEVLEYYKKSHFLILPSKSEGWPKVVAEAMFWGCVPIVTPVSCVPFMLDYGNRGLLLTMNFENDVKNISSLLCDSSVFTSMSELSKVWSRQYTLEYFEEQIIKLLVADNK